MMTLPAVEGLRPGSVAEAVEALRANPGARVLAGGTDIVPNLKYGMYQTRHLVALRGLSKEDAYTLCSLAADFHVTQMVNVAKGAHCMLPKSILG